MTNQYIEELTKHSKLFFDDLLELSKLAHSSAFDPKMNEILLKYFIADTKVNKVEITMYALDAPNLIAPYAIHHGPMKNAKHLMLEEAALTIVIYDKLTREQYDSILDSIVNMNSNPHIPKRDIPIQLTGRSRGFSRIDDALLIYREKQTGKTIKEIVASKKLSITSENCSTMYYKIKKLIDNQSFEK